MYICSEESFGLRRSCNEVRLPEFWLSEDFAQIRNSPVGKDTERCLHTFSQLSLATLNVEGCPFRRVPQQGFGRSVAQNRGLGDDVSLKNGGRLLLFLQL